jgi:hypothetical protein
VFLRLNGWRIVAEAAEAHVFLIGLLDCGASNFDNPEWWLRQSIQRLWCGGGRIPKEPDS